MDSQFGLDRRALLQRTLVLVGAASASGFSAEALAARAATRKRSLAPAQYMLLASVADTILPRTDTPGAVEVGVPALFDALLAKWASPSRRADLVAALTRIDAAAIAKHKKAFAAITPAQRKTLLAAHDVAALKPIPSAGGGSFMAMMEGPAVADRGYRKMKELILTLYYSSEIGLTRELDYQHVPGEWQPSIKLTPETRASGGSGMF